ncbi:MAG: TolC family protein [Spirochaetales bacterium]|uniref:TolC family protein n=1 Tax=Candidatus Thalassospirochaeta sargassi TaxID=3119039 RepID=A0AAJ1MHV6_9SPIO|nr:TolC family protein [Spirochaetales bacterium]
MKRFIKTGLLAAIICSAATLNTAAEALILDIETCIEMALENNPDFLISNISLRTAQRDNNTVWNNFLPTASLSGYHGGSSAIISDTADFSWSTYGKLSMSLSLNAEVFKTIESIRLAYENEQISYETAKRELVSTVEEEFYYLITSKSSLEITKASLELAQKNYEQTLSNYNHGMASELSVLQAEINAANLKPTYKQSLSNHESRLRNFLIVLGMDPEQEIELEGELNTKIVEFDAEQLIPELSNRLDLQTIEKNIEILSNSRTLTALSNKSPTLTASGSWQVEALPSYADILSLSLTLSIPIDDFIPGSSTSVSLAEIDDQIQQYELRLGKAMNEARIEIINLIEQLETAADNMDISALNITLAEKTYEMSQQSFARGVVERLDVEDAQQAYLSAKHQYLSSQYDYLTGLISLRDALGLSTLDELYSKGEIE